MLRRALAVLAPGLASMLACASEPPAAPHQSADPTTLRHLPAGDVVGKAGTHGGHAWLGIPFAEPPLGELRWRAPQPLLLPWTGTREALGLGAPCPQFASAVGGDASAEPGTLIGSEDCLSLNVYAPAFAAGELPSAAERLPVMVWIHGGGNTIGTSGFYDGSRLARLHRVVVVTVNYRLGPLGWFRHAALREGRDAVDASGNFGTLDQIRALEWVQANVAGFGGDPGNVTVLGESAGGQSVFVLLSSPLAKGLFHRAIVQSGRAVTRSLAEAENLRDAPEPGSAHSSGEILLALLESEGRAEDRKSAEAATAELEPVAVASFLRSLPADRLLAAYRDDERGDYDFPSVFRDGTVIPREPLHEVLGRAGAYHAVPVMLGTNRDELKLFFFLDPARVRRWFGLPRLKDPASYHRDAAYRTRAWKVTGVDDPARALARAQPGQVFAYRFDWDEEPSVWGSDFGEMLGAAHGLEIPFVFGHWEFGPNGRFLFDQRNRLGREALSEMMMSYWTEFARSGDPGRGRDGTLPRWSPWQEDGDKYVLLDTPSGGGVRMASESEQLDDVAAAILADASFESDRERCQVLAALTEWTRERFGEAQYRAAGGGRCAAFPPAELLASASGRSP